MNTFAGKTWYRGLKVIFFALFAISATFAVLMSYAISGETVQVAHCNNGKQFIVQPDYLGDFSASAKLLIFKKCDLAGYYVSYFTAVSDISPKGLSSSDREQLKDSVNQLIASNAYESEIKTTVDSFLSQHGQVLDLSQYKLRAGSATQTPQKFNVVETSDHHLFIANYSIEQEDKFGTLTRAVFALAAVLITATIFWLISRIFLYITVGEHILRIGR